jgi:hypothetical protein
LNYIGSFNPIFWVHDTQFAGHWFYEACSKLIMLTPQHCEYEISKNTKLADVEMVINPGMMDTNNLWPMVKQDFALWAHRPTPHKGLDLAAEWAEEKGVMLEVMVARPHEEVIRRMRSARWFVLLSHIFDPGPRAIMEAQPCGCEIIVNENVGWFDESPHELSTRLQNADKAFWATVLDV